MKKVFFIDFDGTITTVDTCTKMVATFAREGWKEIEQMWERGELTTEECANRLFALLDAKPEDISKLMKTIEIDPYFIDFLKMCQDQGHQVFILSDGYDENIRLILDRYQIVLPYYANKMIYDNGFRIQSPYDNKLCKKCGTCKTNLMQQLQGDAQSIYIGDGYSDICPAEHADVVYAKGVLYDYCTNHGIPAIPYQSFKDFLENTP